MTEQLNGQLSIGGRDVAGQGPRFAAVNPASGEVLEPEFTAAGDVDIDLAGTEAWAAFARYRHSGLPDRAAFLETIAANIDDLGDVLINRAAQETALSSERLQQEQARTTAQLRMFADVVRDGRWLGLRVDPGLEAPSAGQRVDLRQRRIPLGPVAVFAASNFPLAFSVAGGDTASALAAGAPVIVKTHPGHPGTSELVGRAVTEAVTACDLPRGTFALLHGVEHEVAIQLVRNPHVRAVAFTGSRSGGLALAECAARRAGPIPVFSEMSSVNPVFLLPRALAGHPEGRAEELLGSMMNSAGQLCTNPGVVFMVRGPDAERFLQRAAALIAAEGFSTMLSEATAATFRSGIAVRSDITGVECRAQAAGTAQSARSRVSAHLHVTDLRTFARNPRLHDEVFGPATLVVLVNDEHELAEAVESLDGQLAVSIHTSPDEHPLAQRLIEAAELKAGRLIVNGWPTGVTVGHAVIHGGPYPATTDARFTSVGSAAIDRFLRPVSYQGFPEALLPAELHDQPSERLPRLVDGRPEASPPARD